MDNIKKDIELCITCKRKAVNSHQCLNCGLETAKYEEELCKKFKYRNSYKKTEKLFLKTLEDAGNELNVDKKISLCNYLIAIVNFNNNYHNVTPNIFKEINQLIDTISI